MDFRLSEEQRLLQDTIRGFVEKECPPTRVRERFDGDGRDPALWRGLAEMGVAGLLVPEAQGGAGLSLLDLALVSEELGRGAVPAPFLGHSLATLALLRGGSPEQQERWLPGLASGALLGSVALAETSGAWEASAWSPRVEGGRVTGAKGFVGPGSEADLWVVGVAGGRLALVSRDASGVSFEAFASVDRGRPLEVLGLEAAPCELLPGDAADGVRDAGLVLLAADAFGAGFQLVRMAAAYANERTQFGQPVAQFQAVKHQLADMALAVEPVRGLWWYAAHALDVGAEDASRMAALAKAHISDRAMEVARAAVEVHGGLGFTWECDVQIWFKRVLFDRVYMGAPDRLRDRVAALGAW